MKRDRRAFRQEFKEEAVGLVRRSGKSANQVAKELGINQNHAEPMAAGGG